MRPPQTLRQGGTDINRLQSRTPLLLLRMRHRIRHHHPRQLTAIQRLDGVPAQDAVCDDGDDLLGAVGHDGVGGFDEGAAGVRHVVDEDRDLAADVADEGHFGDFVGTGALFVDEGEVQVEAVGYGGCSDVLSVGCSTHRCGSGEEEGGFYLFAPPASGLTMTALLTSRFSLIHRSVLGSAYKLSTGTLKNPWI